MKFILNQAQKRDDRYREKVKKLQDRLAKEERKNKERRDVKSETPRGVHSNSIAAAEHLRKTSMHYVRRIIIGLAFRDAREIHKGLVIPYPVEFLGLPYKLQLGP